MQNTANAVNTPVKIKMQSEDKSLRIEKRPAGLFYLFKNDVFLSAHGRYSDAKEAFQDALILNGVIV